MSTQLERIQRLTELNEFDSLPTTPFWILSEYGGHMSGVLRHIAYGLPCYGNEVELPNGEIGDLQDMLMEAADALDDAHEEWLEEARITAAIRSM